MLETILLLNSGWVMLFVRVVLGSVMVYYGWSKVKDLKLNTKKFAKLGFRPAGLWANLAAFIEFLGGIAILAGFLAEIAALLFAIQVLVGVIWKSAKLKKAFEEWSYELVLFAVCLVLITFGPGFYSLLPLF